jgi:hypothetical protein
MTSFPNQVTTELSTCLSQWSNWKSIFHPFILVQYETFFLTYSQYHMVTKDISIISYLTDSLKKILHHIISWPHGLKESSIHLFSSTMWSPLLDGTLLFSLFNYESPPTCPLYDAGFQIPLKTLTLSGNCSALGNGKPSTFYVAYSQEPEISS